MLKKIMNPRNRTKLTIHEYLSPRNLIIHQYTHLFKMIKDLNL